MQAAILIPIFIVLPFICCLTLLYKFKPEINSLFKVGMAWFAAQIIATGIIYQIACLITDLTPNVLFKATLCFLIALSSLILVSLRKIIRTLNWKFTVPGSATIFNIIFAVISFTASYFIYSPHLKYEKNIIYRSPVYWDFGIHYPVINNFVFGDNFPPVNEAASGVPMTYHFMHDLWVSIFSALGLTLTSAITLSSILSLGFFLILLTGFCQWLFNSKIIGCIAGLMTLTSGSMRFFIDPAWANQSSLLTTFGNILKNNAHPFYYANIDVPNVPLFYYGSMFNFFYFTVERHYLFAMGIFIIAIFLILNREGLTYIYAALIGALFGSLLEWHISVCLLIGLLLFLTLISGRERKISAIMLVSYSIIAALKLYIYYLISSNPEWFLPILHKSPKFNFNFINLRENNLSFIYNFFVSWFLTNGLKPLFFISAVYFWSKKHRERCLILTSFTACVFLLVNTTQVFPLSIYENHKWIKPLMLIVDIMCAYMVAQLFASWGNLKALFPRILSILLLTAGGFVELMPFINSTPTLVQADYPTPLMQKIRVSSEPKASFASTECSRAIFLAGRKVYIGNFRCMNTSISALSASFFNTRKRIHKISRLYNSKDLREFCSLALNNNIDYVHLAKRNTLNLPFKDNGFSSFDATDTTGSPHVYVHTAHCKVLFPQ